jgi:hypothetical protein
VSSERTASTVFCNGPAAGAEAAFLLHGPRVTDTLATSPGHRAVREIGLERLPLCRGTAVDIDKTGTANRVFRRRSKARTARRANPRQRQCHGSICVNELLATDRKMCALRSGASGGVGDAMKIAWYRFCGTPGGGFITRTCFARVNRDLRACVVCALPLTHEPHRIPRGRLSTTRHGAFDTTRSCRSFSTRFQ